MNTENIKNAIMKMAVSDPQALIEALDSAHKHIGYNLKFALVVSWMSHNLRTFGCIFAQKVDAVRGNAIKESSIDKIAEIIAEHVDILAENMPKHLAEVIGLESASDETLATSTSEGITF